MAEDVSDKELIPQIYKELIQFNSNKIKLTQWGKKWTDWTIFFFLNKYPQIAKKYMKRGSTSLMMREMQIKITMRCHFIPKRNVI